MRSVCKPPFDNLQFSDPSSVIRSSTLTRDRGGEVRKMTCRTWLIIASMALATPGCEPGAPAAAPRQETPKTDRAGASPTRENDAQAESVEFERRTEMIERQIKSRGIDDERVLRAIANVPRHEFVPAGYRDEAYADGPLPIGHGQTISQPYIVALMTQSVRLEPTDKVLDIGTGSGYQAAVLAEIVDHVYSIEIVEPLGKAAETRLRRLGYDNVSVRVGDGFQGWPDEAPFDVIVLAAAPEEIPPPLIEQLAPGGRLILPVGERNDQHLMLIEKDDKGAVTRKDIGAVRFVPMTGEAEKDLSGETGEKRDR